MSNKKAHHSLRYFSKNIFIVTALVMIWRGVWYLLDELDISLLGGDHLFTAISGIILGVLFLWLPDHDLKEIEKL